MGQIISNLWRWIFPQINETQRNDQHHQTNYQTFSSHCITIPNNPFSKIENEGNHDINSNSPISDIVVDVNSGYEEVGTKKPRRKKKKKEANIDDNVDGQFMIVPEVVKSVSTSISHNHHQALSSVGKIGSYTSAQRILLIGEGDFSFAACLAIAFGTSAVNIFATSLRSTKFLTSNYTMFGTNKAELESRGSTVLHGVDATKLVKHHILGSNNMVFDRIIFNFPHAANICSADVRVHQKLISGFLRNAKEMIQENGEIHITAKSNGCYLDWDIPKLGSDIGLNLIHQVKFKRRKYPGYNPKYGYGGDRNLDCNPSKTYKFGLPHK